MQRPKTYFYFRNYKYRNLVNLQAYLFIYLFGWNKLIY